MESRAWSGARGISTDWLVSFVAVVELGGFSKAAQALHRSQSRVSAHIAGLEAQVGAPLLDRGQRPVGLTDAGEVFLPHARDTLGRLEAGAAHVAAVTELAHGEVRIGSYASASSAYLPRIMANFATAYPHLRIFLAELNVWELESALLHGDIGLALRPSSPDPLDETIATQPLWQEPILAVVHPDHPAATSSQPVNLADILHGRMLSVGHARTRTELHTSLLDTDRALLRAGVDLESVIYTQHPQALVSFVREGMGVGLANALGLGISDTSGVAVLALDDAEAVREVAVCWNADRYQPSAERRLLEQILAGEAPPGTTSLRQQPDKEDSDGAEAAQ